MSTPTPRVVTAQQFAEITSRGQVTAGRNAADMWALCGVVFDIWTCHFRVNDTLTPCWQAQGFVSYLDMVDARLGIGPKTAAQMKNAWHVMEVLLGTNWNRNLRLPSWRKMYLVSRYAMAATVTPALRAAANKSVRELEDEVREVRSRRRGSPDLNFIARISNQQKALLVSRAIARFQGENGKLSNGEFLYFLTNRYMRNR